MRYILCLIAIILAPAAFAFDRFSETNAGTWQGVGVQIDGQEWSMGLIIDPISSTVSYDGGNCSGTWTHIRVTEAHLVAVEKLTIGLDSCLDGGLLKVERLDENTLLYSYFDKAGDIVAKAILIEGEYRQDRYKALRALTLERIGKGFIKGQGAIIQFGDDKI